MRWLLFTDAHISVRFSSWTLKALDFIINNITNNLLKIDNVLFLGDLFHSRTVLHTKLYRDVCARIMRLPIPLYCVIGNHDVFEDCGESHLMYMPNVVTVHTPQLSIDPQLIILPWGSKEQEIKNLLNIQDVKYAVGHIEVDIAYPGMCGVGIPQHIFSSLKHIFLGHYHVSLDVKNICVLGSMIRTSFAEEKSQPRAVILDTEKDDVSFLELPSPTFKTIFSGEDMSQADFVRVVVRGRITRQLLEKYKGATFLCEHPHENITQKCSKTLLQMFSDYTTTHTHISLDSKTLYTFGLQLLEELGYGDKN